MRKHKVRVTSKPETAEAPDNPCHGKGDMGYGLCGRLVDVNLQLYSLGVRLAAAVDCVEEEEPRKDNENRVADPQQLPSLADTVRGLESVTLPELERHIKRLEMALNGN